MKYSSILSMQIIFWVFRSRYLSFFLSFVITFAQYFNTYAFSRILIFFLHCHLHFSPVALNFNNFINLWNLNLAKHENKQTETCIPPKYFLINDKRMLSIPCTMLCYNAIVKALYKRNQFDYRLSINQIIS